MVKKPSVKGKGGDADTTEEFFSDLRKKRTKVKEAANEKATNGFTTSEELVELYGLKDKQRITTKARCVKAIAGKKDGKKFVSFNYVILGGQGKGAMPSRYIGFEPYGDKDADEAFDDAMKDIWFEIQRLGYETKGADDAKLKELLEEITEDKPVCMLQISGFKSKSGKNKGKLGASVRALRAVDEEDEDEDEDEEDTEDEEEEEDSEEEEKPSKSKGKGKSKPKKDEDEDEDEESESDNDDEEEEESEEEDDEQPDEDDPSTWIGYEVKYKPEGSRKTLVCVVEAYQKRSKKLRIKDDKTDKAYNVSPDDVSFA